MRAYDWPERLDHQRLGDRLERLADFLRVLLRVGVAHHCTDAFAPVHGFCQLDDAVEGAFESSHALQRLDHTVADAQHGFDLQHRAQHRARATDASATAQKFERCDREVGLHVRPDCLDLVDDRLRVSAIRSERRGAKHDEAERHRDDLRVDHVHALRIGHVRGLLGRVICPTELLGDVDGDDRVVISEQLVVHLSEATRRRLRCGGMCRGRRQLAIELAGRDVHAIEQAASVEVERQRHDGDRSRRSERRRQVGGRVGDDGDAACSHQPGSSECGSDRRRLRRPLKKRDSMGRIATRVTSTTAAVNMAIVK